MKAIHYTRVEEFLTDPSFRKWVQGNDPHLERLWQNYLQQYPDKRLLIEEALQMLRPLPRVTYRPSQEDLEQLWQQIDQSVEEEEKTGRQLHAFSSVKRGRLPYRIGIAATITATLLLLGYWGYLHRDKEVVYQTAYSETKTIVLPDASEVTLNANSTLSYHKDFFGQQRQVWLEGEAFFHVQHQSTGAGLAKFTVHTEDLAVEVLGTRFNVNTRRDKTDVMLREGKVKLSLEQPHDADMVMQPGELVSYSQEQKEIIRRVVDMEIYDAWRENRLVFKNTPVREVIQVLEDNYGLEIQLKDPAVAARHYTGTFTNPDPDIVLQALSVLFGVDVIREGGQVTLQ